MIEFMFNNKLLVNEAFISHFDYPHDVANPSRRPAPALGRILETECARSIAIVIAAGIKSFLSRDWWVTS